MSGYTGLLQPIVVTKSATHEDIIRASALASVQAWLASSTAPEWVDWLNGSFGKTVRRAKALDLDKCAPYMLSSVTVGDATAMAGLPATRENLPSVVKKLQVTGSDAARIGWDGWTENVDLFGKCEVPVLLISSAAGMSTYKTAAQCAHGLVNLALRQNLTNLNTWANNGYPLIIDEPRQKTFSAMLNRAEEQPDKFVVIRDAGHTEVEPGTTTVIGYTT